MLSVMVRHFSTDSLTMTGAPITNHLSGIFSVEVTQGGVAMAACRCGDMRDSNTSESAENPPEYIAKISDAIVLYPNHYLGGPGDGEITPNRRARYLPRVC